MTWIDWAIVIVLAGSVIGGIAQGFFRTSCSLIGLVLGLSLAAWNYKHVAATFQAFIEIEPIADAIGFFLIALVVMAVANLIGGLLARMLHWIGLGCLDRIGGAVVGLFQGVVLVTLGLLAVLAFFPQAELLENSRLSRQFLGACHISTEMTPEELAEKVRYGLMLLEQESPPWMHPEKGSS